MIATYAFLALAVFTLWLQGSGQSPVRRLLWLAPLAAATAAGLMTGILRSPALIWIVALTFALTTYLDTQASPYRHILAVIAILILGGGLMAHQLPGFNNPLVIVDAAFSDDALPFRLRLNFDKTIVGILILGLCHSRLARLEDGARMFFRMLPITAALIGLLLILSFASRYVRFDPKFPPESWLWMGVNLGFTCVAEEAFFRGFIQTELQRRWQNLRRGTWLALAAAAVLFGVAHAGGGPTYVALATVAGFGYGLAYLRTGRIEASILTHFALNATHFFLFTYPALARRG